LAISKQGNQSCRASPFTNAGCQVLMTGHKPVPEVPWYSYSADRTAGCHFHAPVRPSYPYPSIPIGRLQRRCKDQSRMNIQKRVFQMTTILSSAGPESCCLATQLCPENRGESELGGWGGAEPIDIVGIYHLCTTPCPVRIHRRLSGGSVSSQSGHTTGNHC